MLLWIAISLWPAADCDFVETCCQNGPCYAFRSNPSPGHSGPGSRSTNFKRDDSSMTIQRRFKRMLIDVQDDLLLLRVGEMDIWDGADLVLLREGLFKLIEQEGCRAIAIDMTWVKYIPSGFFGMLFDWQEKRGVHFSLTQPQPNVQRMLWL